MASVLFVCTGNICRSPVAERLLTSKATRARGVIARSAGTMAVVGSPIHDSMRSLLREQGVDADDFHARQLTDPIGRGADVVLTMTREQRGAVVAMSPALVRRAFTLLEFALLTGLVELPAAGTPRHRLATATRWAATNRGLHTASLGSDAMDIADPHGQDAAAFQHSYQRIDDALTRVVGALGWS